MLESFIPKLSLAIISLIAVYIFDWIFIVLDSYISPFIKDFLESIFKGLGWEYEFNGFFIHTPNFIFFLILLLIILPFLINLGINNLNPLLKDSLEQGTLSFILSTIIIFIILYLLFKQFYYYKLKNNPHQ